LRALFGALLAAVALVAFSGCGTGGAAHGGNTSNGKVLFAGDARCGSCHTLADAGSRGTVGPNLDDAFRRPKQEDFKQSSIQNVVLDQIRFPTSGSGMPADLVTGQDAKDVAAYVAQCAAVPKGTGGCTGPEATGVYATLGCNSCHSIDGSKSTGPTFKSLYGSTVTLTNGQTVKADEDYLLESIVDPDKQIVKGYQPGVMSAVIKKGQVSQADAKQLVDFIKTLK
jgi:mono/diheme cytochrome c family protein/cytochrome c553